MTNAWVKNGLSTRLAYDNPSCITESGQGQRDKGDISADSDRNTAIGLVPSEPILNGR